MAERKQKICGMCGIAKWRREFVGDSCKRCLREAEVLNGREGQRCRRCHMMKPLEDFEEKGGRRLTSCRPCSERKRIADRKYPKQEPPPPRHGYAEIGLWNRNQWGRP